MELCGPVRRRRRVEIPLAPAVLLLEDWASRPQPQWVRRGVAWPGARAKQSSVPKKLIDFPASPGASVPRRVYLAPIVLGRRRQAVSPCGLISISKRPARPRVREYEREKGGGGARGGKRVCRRRKWERGR